MSDVAIRVDGLGKRYRIGGKQQGYKTFREAITRTLRAPLDRLAARRDNESNTFWALKDVSFEVKQGEVLGIIGRNGAGKSTLLKILSRITEPTEGAVYLKGRIGALLEVGTGFHPELTGRENIYLSGTILGMTRAEVTRKFDEIVDFAGVEQFIDTPVKRYSSGMGLRLGFAVAAHLEPEILVVDEVLAVGDAEFQKKCLGKMSDVAGHGRTVLFVSHNMSAVQQLCQKAILLEAGQIRFYNNTYSVVKSYLSLGGIAKSEVDLTQVSNRKGSGKARFSWVQIRDKQGQIAQEFSIGDDIILAIAIQFYEKPTKIKLALEIYASDGLAIANITDTDCRFQLNANNAVESITVRLNDVRFYPDTYYINLWAGDINSTDTYDYVKECISFSIINGGHLTMRHLPRQSGLLFLTPNWSQQGLPNEHFQ